MKKEQRKDDGTMRKSRCFDYGYSDSTLIQIKYRMKRIQAVLERYEDDVSIYSLDLKDAHELVYQLETSAYSIRKGVEESGKKRSELEYCGVQWPGLEENYPIAMEVVKDGVIIRTPFLLPDKRRSYSNKKEYLYDLKHSYHLANYVGAYLNQFDEDSEVKKKVKEMFKEKTFEIMIFTQMDQKIIQKPIDLDNLETSHLINILCGFIGRSDNSGSLKGLHSVAVNNTDVTGTIIEIRAC